MAEKVFRVDNSKELRKAGPTDLVELLPVPGTNPLYLPKKKIEILTYGIAHHEFIHLSGPTGTAKSSLLEALTLPKNFCSICTSLGFNGDKPIKLYPIEMAIFESPGELYQRRALKNGTTYDEKSILVQALEDAARHKKNYYVLIWLREMGRVHSASIQGGLLNLMTKTNILLPDGSDIDGTQIAWVADSNYQAESDAIHTLVTLDDALKRRFSGNITLDYLAVEQEEQVLYSLIEKGNLQPNLKNLIPKVVKLGQKIRHQRLEGNLQSVTPPSIYGYQALLRMIQGLPHLSFQEVVLNTLLGNANLEDKKMATAVFNEVFGLQSEQDEENNLVGSLF